MSWKVLGDFIFTRSGGFLFSRGGFGPTSTSDCYFMPLVPLVVCKAGKTLDPQWQPCYMNDAVDIPKLGARCELCPPLPTIT